MTTTMNFKLSPTLLQSLTAGGSGNNVYAYAFAFAGGSLIGSSTLINNGVVDALSINLPASFPSGTVYVGAGTFTRGCDADDAECEADAQPAHLVTLSRPFCLSVTELTVGQYRACVDKQACPAPAELRCSVDHASWTPTQSGDRGELLPMNWHSGTPRYHLNDVRKLRSKGQHSIGRC